MTKGLRAKVTYSFLGTAAGIILLAGFLIIVETHYHFQMYLQHPPVGKQDFPTLNYHIEQAVIQSIIWTSLGAIMLVFISSFYLANRLTKPLIEMKKVAEEMAHGNLEARTRVNGEDEISDLGNSLNQLAEQLKKQETLRKTLTADVAHELRTPLTTLKSNMEAIQDGILDPTPDRIQSCYEEIERLIELVNDLEELSFVESPEFALQKEMSDVAKIVSSSIQALEPVFDQKGVELHWISDSPALVLVDQKRIKQVFINLLSNALKFTEQGGKVFIKLIRKEVEVLIQVSDTGIGMDEEEAKLVFERFYRAEKSRNRKLGGAGIGLTIVKRLVEAHDGEVWIESVKGVGTTVFVRLPREKKSQ